MKTIQLWDNTPGQCEEVPVLEYYQAENKKTNGTVVILPGGGYTGRAPHEGQGYAEYLNSIGIDAFVLQYRVAPHRFPLPLLDARRAVRYLRYHAKEFGIDPQKIAVMGSSAGGSLTTLISTYRGEIDFENQDEIDKLDYLPNYQILAYPVVSLTDLTITHTSSVHNLVGEDLHLASKLDPIINADEKTPKAFIWHTSNDGAVNVTNSLRYGEKLRSLHIQFEMHVFPDGVHGLGLAKNSPHVAQWTELLKNWLTLNSFFE